MACWYLQGTCTRPQPWLGGQFNAALVNAHKVGTVSFYGQYIEAGQLSYTVNGTTVYKQIERQLLREENLSGSYYVANVGTTYDCTNPAANKTAQVVFDMTIQQNNQAITITFTDGSTTSCTAQGTYWQAGRMGDIQATEVCANGVYLKPCTSTRLSRRKKGSPRVMYNMVPYRVVKAALLRAYWPGAALVGCLPIRRANEPESRGSSTCRALSVSSFHLLSALPCALYSWCSIGRPVAQRMT